MSTGDTWMQTEMNTLTFYWNDATSVCNSGELHTKNGNMKHFSKLTFFISLSRSRSYTLQTQRREKFMSNRQNMCFTAKSAPEYFQRARVNAAHALFFLEYVFGSIAQLR